MKKNNIKWIICLLSIVIVFCVSNVGTKIFGGFASVAATNDTIKIGAVFHLTGAGAFWGIGEQNGTQMAIDEVNMSGGINGKKISLILEDGATDFTKTANSIQKLINVDGTKAIIGPTWFGQAASPLAKQFKAIIISPSAGVVPESNKYFFDVWPTEKQEVMPVVRYMQEKGVKNVAIIYSQNDFSQSVRNNFIEQAKILGINVIKEFSVNPNESDFKTIILQLKNLKIDAVYGTFAFYPSQGAYSKQAKELGLNLALYSSSGTEIPDLVKSYPEVEGTIYGYIAMGPKEANFYSKYQTKFNSFPSPSASYAYDATNLIIEAIKAGNETPEQISSYLMGVKYSGVANDISFDSNGRIANKTFIIKTVKDGKFVEIK